MTPDEKRQIALKLGKVARSMQQRDPRACWKQLAAEVRAGRQVTPAVRQMLRDALRADAPLPTDGDDPDIDYAARERRQAEQERIRQYAAERGLPLANGG